MTGPLLEPEEATQPPRARVTSGLVLGVVAAAVLSWLSLEGWMAFLEAGQEPDAAAFVLPGWLLVVGGIVLGTVGFAGRFHPLIPGVPAIWFAIVLGPGLVGLGLSPSWLPGFMSSFALRAVSPAIYVILGYLILATGVSLIRRRRTSIFR